MLHSDDLPPSTSTLEDRLLNHQLETSLSQCFYAACVNQAYSLRDYSQGQNGNRLLLTLLSQCQWHITTQADLPTLVIECPSLITSWRVLENLVTIGSLLEQLAIAKIRICPPLEQGTPLEVRVDELSVYQYGLDLGYI